MSDAPFDSGDHPIDRLLAGDPPASADEEPLWATAAELHSALRPLPMDVAARAALKERLLAAPAVPRGAVRGKVRPWQVPVGRSSWLGSPVARAVLAAACVIVVAGLAYKAVATPPETSTPPRPVAVGMNPTPSPMPVLVVTPTATVAAQATQSPVPTLPAVSSPTSRPPATATSAPAETSTQVPTPAPTATLPPAPVATLPPVIVTPPGVTVVPPPSPSPTVPPSPTLPPTPPPAPTATVEVPFPTRGTALRTATPLPLPTRTPPTAVPSPTATTRRAVTLVPTRPPATARPSSTPAPHRATTIPSAVPSIAAPTPAPLHPRPTVPLVAAQPTATRAPVLPTQPIPPFVRLATAAVPTRVPEAPRATATPRPLLRAPATATASPAPPRATDVPPSPTPAGPVQAQVLVTPAPRLAQAGYAINSSPTATAPPFVLVPYPRPLNAVLGSPLAIAQPLPIGADVLLSRTLPAALPTSASVANASAPVVGAGVALNLATHLGPAFTSAATSTLKNQTGIDTPFTVVGPWNQGTYRLSVGAGQSSFLVKLTMVRQAAPLATNDSSLAHSDVSAQALWLLRKLGLAQDNLEPQYVSTAGSADAQSVAFGQTIGGAMVLGHTSALVTLDGGGRLLSLQYAYLVTTGAQSYPLRGLVQAKADLEQGRGFYTGPTSVETGAPLVVRGIDLAYVAVQGTAGPGAVYLEPVYVFTGTVHRADGEPPFTAYVPALDPRAYAP